MARYVKRGNSWQYEISYKKADGKYSKIRKSGFKTKPDAKAAALELEYELSRGLSADKKDSFLPDYFENWMKLYKKESISPVTYKKYEDTLNSLKRLAPFLPLSEMDREAYQRLLNKYAKNHAKETVIKFNNHVRACMKDAIDDGVIYRDPTRKAVIKGNNPSKRKEDKYLNYDDLKRVLAESEKHLNPEFASPYLVMVAAKTGLRFSELLGLTWDDIDFGSKLIDVNKTWNYKLKKFGPTKNESSIRKVIFDDHTSELLNRLRIGQAELFKSAEVANPHNLVFYNLKNGIVSNNAANKFLKKILTNLNIDTNLTLHGLRHTYASILLYKQINILTVSKLLGHRDTTTTQETYAHIVKELEDHDLEKIGNIMKHL
ncbi:tyrosine-type recombinase/integrase [Erwinia sp. CPCC 100877]|nr:tyrosine-type recombinase/integrase [Erwinia sp. CPCC 100877]